MTHCICATIDFYYCSLCGTIDPVKDEPCRGPKPTYAQLEQKVLQLTQRIKDLEDANKQPYIF